MRFIDYILLAFRNIRRQKLRSALTIFAVVIGATSVTIMLALVFSLKGFMTKQFEANGTFQQVAVSPQTDIKWDSRSGGGGQCADCVKLTDDLVSKIAKESHVIGVARQTYVNQFQALQYGSQKLRLNQVMAYDTNGIITTNVVAGRDIRTDDKDGVLTITSDYADQLGFKNKYQALVGKQISMISQGWYTGVGSDPLKAYQDQQQFFSSHPNASGQDYQPPPVTLSGTIVGIVRSDQSNYAVRVPLSWARGLEENQQYNVDQAAQQTAQAKCRNVPGPCGNTQPTPTLTVTDELATQGYNALIVKVDQSSNAAMVAKTIRNKYKVGAADAQTQIKQQLAIFNILGAVLGGIGGIALAVAAVGVVNTMIMAILERTREIGAPSAPNAAP
jgi:cell division protein FtsX